MSKETYIEKIRPHDSAYKHVSGYAEYTDDINEPKNTIYGAIGLSQKAHAIIKKIDLTEKFWGEIWQKRFILLFLLNEYKTVESIRSTIKAKDLLYT